MKSPGTLSQSGRNTTVMAAAAAAAAAVVLVTVSIVVYILFFANPSAGSQGEQLLWQIGEFDNDYAELAIAGNSKAYKETFPEPVVFHVGEDDPSVSWPYVHPGPTDWSWAGEGTDAHYFTHHEKMDVETRFTEGPHPCTIVFNLDKKPKGTYTLKIGFVGTQPAVSAAPKFEVRINDGVYTKQLPNGKSDNVLNSPVPGGEYMLEIQFPAELLQKGENTIRLNSLTGSWAVYDALSLSYDAGKAWPAPQIKGFMMEPTPLVTSGEQNKRIVEASANITQPLTPGYITYKSGKKEVRVPFVSDGDGLVNVELPVDDYTETTELKAVLHSGKKSMEAKVKVEPSRPWRLYIYSSIHVDNGYTAHQEFIEDTMNDNILSALELMEEYPDFQYASEVSMYEKALLEEMTEEQKEAYIKMRQEGRLSISARFASMLDPISSHESFIRDLYPTHLVAKEYGLPNLVAASADVNTNIKTLPSILAGSGVKYFVAGLNRRDDGYVKNMADRPFYWEGPDGESVLTWLSSGHGEYIGYGAGLYFALHESVEDAKPRILEYLSVFDRKDYMSDAVLAYGVDVDNRNFSPNLLPVIEEWNEKYASPKIYLTAGPSFFEDIEEDWEGTIPTYSGDAGAGWENGAGSSAAETSLVRNASEMLTGAEKLNAFNALNGLPVISTDKFMEAWRNASYYNEHSWGAEESVSNPTSQFTKELWETKQAYALNMSQQAKDLLAASVQNMAGGLKVKEPSLVVFNPTSEPVSQWVEAETSSGKTVTFYAEDVPAMGYKIIPESAIPRMTSSQATYDANTLTLSNQYYAIQVDSTTGGVISIYDKALDVELVKQDDAYQANQYLYYTYNDSMAWPPQEVTHKNGADPVTVTVEDRPEGKALIIKTKAYNTPEVVTEILLHDDAKRIDFNNTLNKTEVYDKEYGFFTFPFNLTDHTFHVDIPDGILDPAKDGLTGVRFDWVGTQDFAVVEGKAGGKDVAITWTAVDSPLMTFSGPSFDLWAQNYSLDNSTIFGYVFNNHWHVNHKASQGGEMVFRFSLTSSEKYDPAESAQFGQSVRQPLVAAAVAPANTGADDLSPASYSFADISTTDVKFQAVKQAESGQGIIVRLRNMTESAQNVTITLNSGTFKEAWLCNLMEDPQSQLELEGNTVTVPIKANGITTILLMPQ